MSYKVAAAAAARRATPKVSFGRAAAARREFLYMKLYMDGSNIDVHKFLNKKARFETFVETFLHMDWKSRVEESKACREASKFVERLIYLLGYILIRC